MRVTWQGMLQHYKSNKQAHALLCLGGETPNATLVCIESDEKRWPNPNLHRTRLAAFQSFLDLFNLTRDDSGDVDERDWMFVRGGCMRKMHRECGYRG